MPNVINAQVVQHLRPGGIETMALDLIAGTDDIVCSLEGNKADALAAWPRLRSSAGRLVFMDKKPGIDLTIAFRLAHEFWARNVGAVHSHHVGPLLYGGVAARLAGVSAVIHTEHDAWHLENRKQRFLQKALLRIVRPQFVADTRAVAEAVAGHLRIAVPKIIGNGVDIETFSPGPQDEARRSLGLPENVPLVGCAARLEELKGHRYLLDAMAFLPNDVHLALAGDGTKRKGLEARAKERKIYDRVHFLGTLDDMAAFYNAIDVFCLPSLKEGMPLSPLEAQACGRPAVVTDVGGSAASVCLRTGYLVSAADVDALSKGIVSALRGTGDCSPRAFVADSANLETTRQAYRHLYTV